MFTLLAVLVYSIAVAIPVYLLYLFRSQAWYWHGLAIGVSLALGLVPTPPGMQSQGFDLIFGFLFVALMFWGIGGLIVYLPHDERHASHWR